MQDIDIYSEILKMSLEARQLFDKGDALFTQQRQSLDLDAALDVENYSDEASRAN